MPRVPYYASIERQNELRRAAAAWQGTPFRLYNQIPGKWGGVDCVLLLEDCNVRTGCIAKVDKTSLPRYPEDWSAHNGEELLEQFLTRLGFLARCDRVETLAATRPGDILVFRPGKSHYHLGQVISPEHILHILRGGPVRYEKRAHPVIPEWFSYALRPMEEETPQP